MQLNKNKAMTEAYTLYNKKWKNNIRKNKNLSSENNTTRQTIYSEEQVFIFLFSIQFHKIYSLPF